MPAKLTVSDLRRAKKQYEEGRTLKEVAASFGVSLMAVHDALTGKTHVGAIDPVEMRAQGCRGEANPRAKMTEAKVRRAKRMRDRGRTDAEIAASFGVAATTIWKALNGDTWPGVADGAKGRP